jgi:hypothetical protein
MRHRLPDADDSDGLLMRCEWPCLELGCKCLACGYELRRDYATPPHRTCGPPNQKPRFEGGLGDLAAEFFKSLGITEERYKAVKGKLHLDPNCNCPERQQRLNEFGEQLGGTWAAKRFAEWLSEKRAVT